jgi:hypothetical protein
MMKQVTSGRIRAVGVLLALVIAFPVVRPQSVLAAPASHPSQQPSAQVCGTVVTVSSTSITINATSGASGTVIYAISPGVVVPSGLTTSSPVCVVLTGTTVIGFIPPGGTQVCGIVLNSLGQYLTINTTYGAVGTIVYLLSVTAPVPVGVGIGSEVCFIQVGGTIVQFLTVVSGGGSSSGGASLSKAVQNISMGTAETTAVTAYDGNTIQYRLLYSNMTGTVATASLTDVLKSGQYFVTGSCYPIACFFDPTTQTVSFNLGTLPAGISSSVTFRVTIVVSGPLSIPNYAILSATGMASSTSNTTVVTIPPTSPGPGAVFYPPYYYYPPFHPIPYVPPYYLPPQFAYGAVTICGLVSGFRPPAGGAGYISINNETLILFPNTVVGGAPFTVGSVYCVTFTVGPTGQISSVIIGPNLPGTSYICGSISPYSSGYMPYGYGSGPYSNYSPYPGYNPYGGYGQYPGYGPYSGYGGPTSYGWGGPMVVGGYPFQVAPGTYFPYQPQYGNPYCFLMNPQGSITGSLSAVPTAANAVEEPSGRRLPQGRGMT